MAAKPDNFSYFSLPGEVRNQIMNHVLSYVESEVYIPTAIRVNSQSAQNCLERELIARYPTIGDPRASTHGGCRHLLFD